jgi:AAA15 family ATPase/GTPase
MARMLAFADLGVSDLRLGKQVVPEPLKRIMSQGMKPKDLENVIKGIESVKQVHLVHRAGDGSMPFQPDQESHGTIAYLALLGPILSGLQNGGVVCVDELDASLHPLLATRLIRLFSDRSMNPKGAQLIFNTHDTNLLNRGILRRDQIWFAEKEQDGSSQIYPLTDFQPRKDENLANGYLQGRYGAIPFLSPELLSPGDGTGHEEA